MVPIFLMLRDGDVWLKSHFGSGFLLNNLVMIEGFAMGKMMRVMVEK